MLVAGIVLLLTGAVVQSVEINAMFQSTSLDKFTFWNPFIGFNKTIRKTKGPDSRRTGTCRPGRGQVFLTGVWKVDGAENKGIPDTFSRAMFADYL